VSRLQRSDLDQATLDGLRIMADRLCSEYLFMPGDLVLVEGRSCLRRIVSFQGQRLTLSQHREVLTLAVWIALLIVCIEYDSKPPRVTAWPSSSPRDRRKRGHASGTAGAQKSRSTKGQTSRSDAVLR
jgi:hypothetical protein